MIYNGTITWPNGATIRKYPNTSGDKMGSMSVNSTFKFTELVPDSNDSLNTSKLWAKLDTTGYYVAVMYPSSGSDGKRATYDLGTVPPDTTTGDIVIVSAVVTYIQDGVTKTKELFPSA